MDKTRCWCLVFTLYLNCKQSLNIIKPDPFHDKETTGVSSIMFHLCSEGNLVTLYNTGDKYMPEEIIPSHPRSTSSEALHGSRLDIFENIVLYPENAQRFHRCHLNRFQEEFGSVVVYILRSSYLHDVVCSAANSDWALNVSSRCPLSLTTSNYPGQEV